MPMQPVIIEPKASADRIQYAMSSAMTPLPTSSPSPLETRAPNTWKKTKMPEARPRCRAGMSSGSTHEKAGCAQLLPTQKTAHATMKATYSCENHITRIEPDTHSMPTTMNGRRRPSRV